MDKNMCNQSSKLVRPIGNFDFRIKQKFKPTDFKLALIFAPCAEIRKKANQFYHGKQNKKQKPNNNNTIYNLKNNNKNLNQTQYKSKGYSSIAEIKKNYLFNYFKK